MWTAIKVGSDEKIELDLEVKCLCFSLVRRCSVNTRKIKFLNSNTYYATIYFSLHKLLQTHGYFKDTRDDLDYFRSKVLNYTLSFNKPSFQLNVFNEW